MKILKNLAVLAIAAAVVLTGCENTFSGTSVNKSVLAEYNRSTSAAGITDPIINGPFTNAVNQVISFTFGAADDVDMETVANAVTIRNVSGTVATTVYTQGAEIIPSAVEIRNNVAYFTVSLVGASNPIEIFVDPTVLTARDGTMKLNRDGVEEDTNGNGVLDLGEDVDGDGHRDVAEPDADTDGVLDFGEDVDGDGNRDVAEPDVNSNGSLDSEDTNVNGILNGAPDQGEAGDDDLYFYPTVTGGTAATGEERNPLLGMAMTADPTFNLSTTVSSTLTFTYGRQAGNLDTFDYTSILNGCVVIEKYAPATHSWTAVSAAGTYVTTTGVYTATFAAGAAGDVYRARGVNLQNFKTQTAFSGYIQRSAMDATTTQIFETGSIADPKEISASPFLAVGGVDAIFDSNKLNGYIQLNLNTAITGDQGLDTSTFTSANVKLYDTTDKVFVPFSTVTFRYQDPVATTSGAKDQVTLLLDPSFKAVAHTFVIYLGPGLKALGDVDGTPAAGVFGDITQISSQPYGFRSVTGSTLN